MGKQLFVPDKGIAALLAGLRAVLDLEGFQLGFHGVEDRVVFVHRFVATATIVTESEDSLARPQRPVRAPTPAFRPVPRFPQGLNTLKGLEAGGLARCIWSSRVAPLRIAHTITALSPAVMHLGEVYLESLSTGVNTQEEIDWITTCQSTFTREEEAMALKIGRRLDEGTLQIGCRLLGHPRHPSAETDS